MKLQTIVTGLVCAFMGANAQGNKVLSGGEFINFSIVDISAIQGIPWTTIRSATPGFFSIANNGIYIGCSDSANINGYVKKYGNTPFIFPVGNGYDIRTLEISAPKYLSDTYATAWIQGDPSLDLDPTGPFAGTHSVYDVSYPIAEVTKVGQWDWLVGKGAKLGPESTGSGAGLTITVSMPDLTSFAPASFLRLVGWNGSKWIDLSGKSTATDNTENSLISGVMVEGISAISIGKVGYSLAIKIEEFLAEANQCDAQISWNSSGQLRNEIFYIEQSFDGQKFHIVASVAASASSNGYSYSIKVTQPKSHAYYRIKIKDELGYYSYSPIISCRTNCEDNEFMYVYPNPVSAQEDIHLKFSSRYEGTGEFIIINSIGQRLMAKAIEIKLGSNLVSAPVQDLVAGAYIIIIQNESGTQIGNTQKFIRQ